MAKTKKNLYRLTFTIDNQRAQFTAHTQSEAASIRLHVKRLISAKRTGTPALESEEWAHTRPKGTLRDFLIRWGLLEDTSDNERTIEDLCNHFQKRNVKPGTLKTFKQIEKNLIDFFGADKRLRDLTPLDAGHFETFLNTGARLNGKGGLAKATVKKRIQRVRQFFIEARRLKWINENPFEGIHGGNLANPEKWLYLPKETVLDVMENTPNLETRAKIALCRFAGARGESEFNSLEWNSDWIIWSSDEKRGTVRLHRTKTEDSGYADTIIPMVPELEGALRDLFDRAESGVVKVFHSRSNPGKVIKDQFRRNGIDIRTPYNLRRSYCRDLMEGGVDPKTYEYYCGHSLSVALKHYQQMDELRAQKAAPQILKALSISDLDEKTGTQFGTQLIHNLVHSNISRKLAGKNENIDLSLENRTYRKIKEAPAKYCKGALLGAEGFEQGTKEPCFYGVFAILKI